MNSAVGPYELFPLAGGTSVAMYLITFDKEGRCQSPHNLAELLGKVDAGKFTDVHVFAHGWNNVFKDALELYRKFFGEYFRQRDERGLNDPLQYRPVAVGIIWPSTLLVMPWEATPGIAAIVPDDDQTACDVAALDGVAESVRPSDADRLYDLVERERLNQAEALELAGILLPVYLKARGDQKATGETGETGPAPDDVTAAQLVALWQRFTPRESEDDREPGFAPDNSTATSVDQQPAAAGLVNWLDPRGPIRVASVFQMKDRAGTVGARGVGPRLTQKLLALKKARIHLIGHSYGAKVILSSLCCQPPAVKAASLLLLEAAISYLCFGHNIDGKGREGGYRDALRMVEQPILSTFSSSDIPLRDLFHLAVIRDSDWGEQKIAGLPPSKFAALGGYGPGGLPDGESETIVMPPPGENYPSGESDILIYAVDGSRGQITGHGDVATTFTAWAHLNLVSGKELTQKPL